MVKLKIEAVASNIVMRSSYTLTDDRYDEHGLTYFGNGKPEPLTESLWLSLTKQQQDEYLKTLLEECDPPPWCVVSATVVTEDSTNEAIVHG